MTTRFAFILLLATLSHVCGWEEFGLTAPADVQQTTNRKRRMSSIWDEPTASRHRIYKIREEMIYESALEYETFIEMALPSLSMSMTPSPEPTAGPVHSEPPAISIPTILPTFSDPSSEPTSVPTPFPSDVPTTSPIHTEPPVDIIPTLVPSDEPTTSPVHSEPPAVFIPTLIPSDEPTTSPVHSEPPAVFIPTLVPSFEPTTSPVHSEPPAAFIPTVVPSDDPTASPVHSEPPAEFIPTILPSDEPTYSPNTFMGSLEPTVTATTSRAPTKSPSELPTLKPSDSAAPTVSQSPTVSTVPSIGPSTSMAPSPSPTSAPSQKPSLSMLPTISASPSSSAMPSSKPSTSPMPTRSASPSRISTIIPSSQNQAAPTLAFDCLNNQILSLGEANDANTTGISLFVGYHVESSSMSTDDYLEELEESLLLTAVAAALGCNRGRRHLMEDHGRKLLKSSTIIDSVPCNTTVDGAVSCTTIETDLVFFLKGEVDPDRAAFSGYSAIRDKMSNDEYIGKIPTVLKLIYKSPLPLPAPPQVIEDNGNKDEGNSPILNARDSKLQVSSWTIGACVASVFGGAVSLLVWSRNRRSRHLRHIQLVEDSSWVDPETSSHGPVEV